MHRPLGPGLKPHPFPQIKRCIKITLARAGWLSWLERRAVHRKVAGLIPSRGTYLGCMFDPPSGHTREAMGLMFLPLHVPPL